jgi:hypothetical protein
MRSLHLLGPKSGGWAAIILTMYRPVHCTSLYFFMLCTALSMIMSIAGVRITDGGSAQHTRTTCRGTSVMLPGPHSKITSHYITSPHCRKNMLGYIIEDRKAQGMPCTPTEFAEMAIAVLQAGTDTSSSGFIGLYSVLMQVSLTMVARLKTADQSGLFAAMLLAPPPPDGMGWAGVGRSTLPHVMGPGLPVGCCWSHWSNVPHHSCHALHHTYPSDARGVGAHP